MSLKDLDLSPASPAPKVYGTTIYLQRRLVSMLGTVVVGPWEFVGPWDDSGYKDRSYDSLRAMVAHQNEKMRRRALAAGRTSWTEQRLTREVP